MNEKTWLRILISFSGNLKSAIQNLKWVGIVVIGFTFAMCGAVAQAQQPGKIFRIGFLDPSTVSNSSALLETFRQELSKLGWIEGKNLVFEYRLAENKTERITELAAELVRLKVDLIVTLGNPPALAAQKATSTIPIVMTGVVDPVAF
jgi:putative ABC transport system substrate-binding protein